MASGLSVLTDELLKVERRIKRFRNYTLGYLHLDTLFTPKINKKRWYVFTAIERVVKIAFLWIKDKKTKDKKTKEMGKKIFSYGMVERFSRKV